ncbi:MAG: T9SS type A sorting domain-containing protein, partial [Candidatus Zixiibacteriota bacterium]
IDVDPVFAGLEREDFHLRWRSPCIDAGVPDSLDPDGTRSDIGAFYFDQDVPGIVELYPHDTPIVIPRQGGELSFDGWVFSFSGRAGRADIWTYLFAPEIGRYGPLDLYNVRIPADSLGLNEISRHVPEVAPEGDYVFVAYVGQYPSAITDSSYFYFTKAGEIVGVPGDWTEDNLPLDYALFQNYPNPFNATTRINYQLPVNAHVKLEVCNLLGQKVATLVDSKQQRGYKSVVWDASEVSSGLYFYKLTAGDFTETRRMILVK